MWKVKCRGPAWHRCASQVRAHVTTGGQCPAWAFPQSWPLGWQFQTSKESLSLFVPSLPPSLPLLLAVYLPLGARHTYMGCQESSHLAWIVEREALSSTFLVFCYQRTQLFLLAAACLAYRVGWNGEGRRSSKQPSSSGSLVAGGPALTLLGWPPVAEEAPFPMASKHSESQLPSDCRPETIFYTGF